MFSAAAELNIKSGCPKAIWGSFFYAQRRGLRYVKEVQPVVKPGCQKINKGETAFEKGGINKYIKGLNYLLLWN